MSRSGLDMIQPIKTRTARPKILSLVELTKYGSSIDSLMPAGRFGCYVAVFDRQ
jgi:hypothetical protein